MDSMDRSSFIRLLVATDGRGLENAEWLASLALAVSRCVVVNCIRVRTCLSPMFYTCAGFESKLRQEAGIHADLCGADPLVGRRCWSKWAFR